MRTLAHPRALARRPIRVLLTQWPLALVDDVEGIHQTRVATRRLRELVPVLVGPAGAQEAAALRRRLRSVTRLLGRSRELDVAMATLTAIEARTPGQTPAVAEIRAHVVRERVQAARDVRARVGGVDVSELAAATQALATRSETPAAIRGCARRVAARLGRRAAELETAVVRAGLIFAASSLHGVRIALKKFRYSLELAERLGRFQLQGSMLRLKRMQDLLGDLHDLQILGVLARDVMSQSPPSRRAEIETLVTGIDGDIRELHSRYVAEREIVVALLARATRVRRALLTLPPPDLAGGWRAAVPARKRAKEDR